MSFRGLPSTLQSSEPGPRPDQRTVMRPLGPRYAASISDTESTTSGDSFRDSGSSRASTSSASSVGGDDEQELTQNLNNLTLSHAGASALGCKEHGSKKEGKEKLPAIKDSSNSPNPVPLAKNTPDTASKANPNHDRSSEILERLLGKQQYNAEVAKAAGNETLACFPTMPGYRPIRNFPASQVTIDIPTWQAGLTAHGNNHGRQAGYSHGSSGNDGASAPPIYPDHVKPPYEWGTRNRRQGGDDGPEENGWGRENRALRMKKRIACPAAKGDPFHNRACLGISFPNLAKTRQHLSCAAHFAVDKTPLLPDEIRDPNGWEEIMAYIYPDKDTPSSDEDFHATMDLIQKYGMGPGKPDFRSTIIRLIQCVIQDRSHGVDFIHELEAIDPSPKKEHGVERASSSFYSPPSDVSSFQSGADANNSSLFTPQMGFHHNSPINSEPSQTTFTSTAVNTPTSGSSGLPSYNHGNLPIAHGFSNHQFSGFASQSTLMDTNRCSPDVPDLHNQADNEIQMNPAGGPSPDKQPQIYVRLPNFQNPMLFGYNLDFFEDWMHIMFPGFSFGIYSLNIINGPIRVCPIRSMEELRGVYPNFGKLLPGRDMILQIVDKSIY
ncbi:uncharacterized protein DFL_002937 [Arthrobotrys flagrans]|uniref:Uncharacterized protein n=1 Tax=Arthrobotrys flagrans TaxID=97331 RepID=A0A437ABX4_ARTFL|nr:hypothetical protein DFL_002937 [Arthrobotrys flagrans]